MEITAFRDLHPFFLLNRQNLYLTCNGQGEVLDIHNVEHFNFPYLIRALKEEPRLSHFFAVDPAKDFSGPWTGFRIFAGLETGASHELFEPFYCCLATIILRLLPVSKDRLQGVIYFSDIVPQLYPERRNAFLYVDEHDRIMGFNQSFHDYFSEKLPDPMTLLRAPAGQFFSPTPGRFQKERVDQALDAADGKFPHKEEWDFTESRTVTPEFFPAEYAPVRTPAGIAVKAEGRETPTAAHFHRALDTAANDFLFELTLETTGGREPLFFLSDRPLAHGVSPDIYGYTVSSDPDRPRFHFKKKGLMMAGGEFRSEESGKTVRYVFGKVGKTLFLRRNGLLVLGYFDPHFPACTTATFSAGFRPGQGGLIQKAVLWTRRSKTLQENERNDLIVTLNTDREHYLSLTRFHTYDLNTKFPHIAGFFLQDVTPLQARVNLEVKKGERLRKKLEAVSETTAPFIGAHPAFTTAREQALTAARSGATILIGGPTGTGKELFARFIHAQSEFHEGPFVKVDCATLPLTLMESELFGHEAGAFTGAVEAKPGLFEMADQGTLFLDEVGNLPLEVQAKLLHFLQDFTLTRLGGQTPLRLRLRVVAASNARLRDMAAAGTFRSDLYFRLAVISLRIPALSERREDIPLLCGQFLKEFNREIPKGITGISPDGYRQLFNYDWPGNVRELKNVLHRAFVFCDGNEITAAHLSLGGSTALPKSKGKRTRVPGRPAFHLLTKMDPAALLAVVEKHRGNLHRIAREVGVTRRALYCHFRKIGLDISHFRA